MPSRRTRNLTETAAAVEAETVETVETVIPQESRRKITRETILEDFDSLIEFLQTTDSDIKTNGIGNFRTVRDLRRSFNETLKRVQKLRRSCDSRLRKTTTRQPSTNTGLNRKLSVNREFANWVGIDPSAEYSRMDINRMWKRDIAPRITDPSEHARFCRCVGIPEGGSPMTYRKFQHAMSGVFE